MKDAPTDKSGSLTNTDLRNLFAAFALAGMDAEDVLQTRDHLSERARLAWRMADAMMATQYEFTAFNERGEARVVK